jgi:hypothetical protein
LITKEIAFPTTSVKYIMARNMFQNSSLAEFKQRLFSKFSKKNKTSENMTNSKNKQVSRSSSLCSIRVTSNEDIVEESIEKGLPIIPFGSPTFIIAEENYKLLKDIYRRNSLKCLKGRITRHQEEPKEETVDEKNNTCNKKVRQQTNSIIKYMI